MQALQARLHAQDASSKAAIRERLNNATSRFVASSPGLRSRNALEHLPVRLHTVVSTGTDVQGGSYFKPYQRAGLADSSHASTGAQSTDVYTRNIAKLYSTTSAVGVGGKVENDDFVNCNNVASNVKGSIDVSSSTYSTQPGLAKYGGSANMCNMLSETVEQVQQGQQLMSFYGTVPVSPRKRVGFY